MGPSKRFLGIAGKPIHHGPSRSAFTPDIHLSKLLSVMFSVNVSEVVPLHGIAQLMIFDPLSQDDGSALNLSQPRVTPPIGVGALKPRLSDRG
jgi:hypothetical protein